MKKVLAIIMLSLLLPIMGCSKEIEQSKEIDKTQHYINAIINDISEDEINVTPIDNENVNSDKKIIDSKSLVINSKVIAASGLPELKKDDKIRIVYNESSITENPLKTNIVFAVYLLDENNEVISDTKPSN